MAIFLSLSSSSASGTKGPASIPETSIKTIGADGGTRSGHMEHPFPVRRDGRAARVNIDTSAPTVPSFGLSHPLPDPVRFLLPNPPLAPCPPVPTAAILISSRPPTTRSQSRRQQSPAADATGSFLSTCSRTDLTLLPSFLLPSGTTALAVAPHEPGERWPGRIAETLAGVDMATLMCLVGRIEDRGQWVIVNRSGDLARAEFVG